MTSAVQNSAPAFVRSAETTPRTLASGNWAIRAENLGKQYRRGTVRSLNDNFREEIMHTFERMMGRGNKPREDGKFWALRNVDLEIQRGETVGIIGRNGAGKSTLLKILSRITPPTEGRMRYRGRLASLLEVGTGFHRELTGRENIYMNGAILGMRRAEIKQQFDAIVDFAGIGEFLDTPVKFYSSGMYVRLAFAVAAHLRTEILVVDEVLAVGDADFQKKCLNKMEDVGQQGRVVLFVSHNMPAITRLCPRAVLLDNGSILIDGHSQQVVNSYLGSGLGTSAIREWADRQKAPGNDIVRLLAVRVRTHEGAISAAIDIRKPMAVEMEYEVLKPGAVLVPNLHFFNDEGICAFILHDVDPEWRRQPRPVGKFVSTVRIPGNFLSEGSLIVSAAICTHNPLIVHLNEREAVAFQVIDSLDADSARGDYAGSMPGVVRPLLEWKTTMISMSGESHAC